MNTLLQDIRGGVRLFVKYRWLTALAVLMLAVGIGSNAAIFSVANAVLFRPVAISDPGDVMVVWERDAEQPVLEVSYANFLDWRARNTTFSNMAAMSSTNWWYELQTAGDPVGLPYAAVSASFFDALGVKAALGRTFVANDERPTATRTVVISHGLWQRQFGSSPDVIGRHVTLKGPGGALPFAIVGVMPPAFEFPRKSELWTPLGPELAAVARTGRDKPDVDRGFGVLYVVGRLKSDVSPAGIKPDLDAIVRHITTTYGGPNPPRETVATPVLNHVFGNVRLALTVLLISVGLVLLIACANVASILLMIGRAREAELAMRYALGASRGRIVRQLMTEGLLLALCGGIAGVLVAQWVLRTLLAVNPLDVPGFADIRMDLRVLLFTICVLIATAIVVELLPAWRATRVSLAERLKGSGTGAVSARRFDFGADLVVIGQIALAAVVVVAAALMVRSFYNITRLDLGFTQERVLTFGLELPDSEFTTLEAKQQAFEQLLSRLSSRPGVEAVGAIYQRPLAHGSIGMDARFLLEGQPVERASFDKNPIANWESVTPGYFAAMRVGLVAGRLFNETDNKDAPLAVIVSESFARRAWLGQQALGKRLLTIGASRDAQGKPRWQTVVGIVRDVRYRELALPRLDVYVPYRQSPIGVRDVVVRTTGNPQALHGIVQHEVAALGSRLQPSDMTTMESVMSKAVAPWRFNTLVFGVFAGIALGLTAVGLFGLVAASVSQRTREIGLRLALGAQSSDVLGLVLRKAMGLSALGIACGSVAAYVLSRLVAGLLFGVAPTDLPMFAVAAAVVMLVALAAAYVPARRATGIDPIVTLKAQ